MLPAAAFMLSFSGLCVQAQALAFLPRGVRAARLLAARALSGLLSAGLAFAAEMSPWAAAAAVAAVLCCCHAVRTLVCIKESAAARRRKATVRRSGAHGLL